MNFLMPRSPVLLYSLPMPRSRKVSIPRIQRTLAAALILTVVGGTACAQLLAEVVTVAAASAQLDPAIRLPSGSYRVMGQIPPSLLAKVEGAGAYGDWEAYTARGVAARLFPAQVHQLTNSFALAGYFQQSRSERTVGDETHTRHIFADMEGGTILLYVIETPEELVWLIGRSG
ncbi:MAG TPA: hypothetical protein VF168_14845 [Trueperaceae bacterium]